MAVRGGNGRGRVAAAMSIIVLFALGLVVPLSISFLPGDLPTGAVVAASGDQLALTMPIALNLLGTEILADRGVLSLSNVRTSGDNGAAERQMLTAGHGTIAADGVTFVFGRPRMAPLDADARDAEPRNDANVPQLLTALAAGQFDVLKLRRSTIHVTVAGDRIEKLGNVSIEVNRRRKASYAFKGSAEIRGLTHAIEGSFGTGDKRAGAPPFKFTVSGPLVKATYDGTGTGGSGVAASGLLDIAVAIDAPSALGLRVLTNTVPSSATSSDDVRIKGQVRWTADALAFDRAVVSIRGQDAQGALHIGFQPKRTTLSGTFAAATVDLAQLMRGDRHRNVALDTLEAFGERLIAWLPSSTGTSVLSTVDADVRLSATRLVGLPLEAGGAAVSVFMRAGKLNASVSEFSYGRGRATGEVTIDFDRAVPVATIRAKADGMDLAGLTAAVAGFPILMGPAHVAIDLKSEGLGADQIARSLDGTVAISQKEWGRFGVDVKALVAAPSRNVTTGWPALRGTTNYDQLDAKLTVRAGSVSVDSLIAKQADGTITVSGGFGLSAGRLFVDVTTQPTGAYGRLLPVPVPADPVAEAVEFRGTLQAPEARRKLPPRAADPASPTSPGTGRYPG